jgi:hypothetical protein
VSPNRRQQSTASSSVDDEGSLDQALRRYATALTSLMRPTAELNYQLAGLDLPTEQAHTTWQALQAAEQYTQRAKVGGGLSDWAVPACRPPAMQRDVLV